uniref:Uncharacterized protein n=1 Tax=Tanacetum cinerariifolium TaxID=118510 RepID=A0A6L2NLT5_TANCI|nr:hypothetical protein [Tanacetum cinerariifolium]
MLCHIIVKDTRTMDMTIDQQLALDEALIPHASRLRIGKSNFRLRSDITSKESILQLVYDVLERFVNLEYFREMLHICPRLPSQTFDELPFEEEILAFLRFLRHNGEIRKITDEDFVYQVEHKDAKKSNKMYYPRFTKVIIYYFMTKDPSIPRRNKFGVMLHVELTNEDIGNSEAYKEYYAVASGAAPPKTKASVRKTKSSFDTTITPPTTVGTRLSTTAKGKQTAKSTKAKGLTVLSEVGMIEAEHMKLAMKRSLQQTHISQASGSGVDEGTGIIPGVLNDDDDQDEGDDDDQDTDNYGDEFVHPKLSIHEEEETKDEESFDPIVQTPKNSDDEGAAPPKTKASVRQSSSDTTITPSTAAGTRLSTSAKGKQPCKSTKAKGLSMLSEKSSDEDDQDDNDQDDNDNDQDTDNNGDDFVHLKLSIHEEEAKDEESFDPIVQTPKNSDDEGNDDANLGLNVGVKRDRMQRMTMTNCIETSTSIWKSSSVSSQFVTSMLNPSPDAEIDSLFKTTPYMDVLASTTIVPFTLTARTLAPPTIPTISRVP